MNLLTPVSRASQTMLIFALVLVITVVALALIKPEFIKKKTRETLDWPILVLISVVIACGVSLVFIFLKKRSFSNELFYTPSI